MKLRRKDLLNGVSLHGNFTVFSALSQILSGIFGLVLNGTHKLGVSLMLYFAKHSGCMSILFS